MSHPMLYFPPNAKALLERWQSMRGGDGVPLRDAMTPETLQPWLGLISLNELRYDGVRERVFVGHQGELVSRGMGDDFHGRYLDDCVPPNALEHAMRPYHLAASEGDAVSSFIAPSEELQHRTHFARLVMPLGDRDPAQISYFLVFTVSKEIAERRSGSIYSLWIDSAPKLVHRCEVVGVNAA